MAVVPAGGVPGFGRTALRGADSPEACGRVQPSALAGNRDRERVADLTHPVVADSAQALDERRDRHALGAIEVDHRQARDRVLGRLEEYLARDPADRGRARPDQCAPQTRNRRVPGEDDDRPADELGTTHHQTLPRAGQCPHDAPAAARNEARSPHSSFWSSGYAS